MARSPFDPESPRTMKLPKALMPLPPEIHGKLIARIQSGRYSQEFIRTWIQKEYGLSITKGGFARFVQRVRAEMPRDPDCIHDYAEGPHVILAKLKACRKRQELLLDRLMALLKT